MVFRRRILASISSVLATFVLTAAALFLPVPDGDVTQALASGREIAAPAAHMERVEDGSGASEGALLPSGYPDRIHGSGREY